MTCPYCHRMMHGADDSGRCTNPACRYAEMLGHEYVAVQEAPHERHEDGSVTVGLNGGETQSITLGGTGGDGPTTRTGSNTSTSNT